MLKFKEDGHLYESTDGSQIDWVSVTSFISHFKQPFKGKEQAAKSAKNKKSKWYGLDPEEILAQWKLISDNAIDKGNWYHKLMEDNLLSCDSIVIEDTSCGIAHPIVEDGIKYAPDQKLQNNTLYPEHFVYLKSAGLCGQSDKVAVINDVVHITDYKTNREIKTEGYTNWEGVTSKMFSPVSHLDDCNLNHYNLQLSIYMYIILKHNPKLKPGKLIIQHIIFEEAGRDRFDNPITARDDNGDPIIKEVVSYELPYLKSEVISLINWLKENKHKLKSKNQVEVC